MKRFKSHLTSHTYALTDVDVELYEALIFAAKKSRRIERIEFHRFQDTLLKMFGAKCCKGNKYYESTITSMEVKREKVIIPMR